MDQKNQIVINEKSFKSYDKIFKKNIKKNFFFIIFSLEKFSKQHLINLNQ